MFRETLFAVDCSRAIVPVETEHGRTYVRSLTVAEKDAFDTAVQADKQYRARILIACCCDERGEPEFDELDVGRLNLLPVRLVEPLVDAAIAVNRLRPEDAEAFRKN